ncbi:GM19235 [Drosophila sechellia]|uniref:GM19235 n=1 Tax=Drosophila sechellia TaxID=7238 RepID=B4I9X6_DROSE|nr:GM19235 [Drosophila sechellia]
MSGRPRTSSFAEGNKQSPSLVLGGVKTCKSVTISANKKAAKQGSTRDVKVKSTAIESGSSKPPPDKHLERQFVQSVNS